jgi:hypothetical protein
MKVLSCLKVAIVAILLTANSSPACFADEQEQVEAIEKLSVHMETLNSAASAWGDLLASVKDPASAEAAAGRVEPTAKAFISALEDVTPRLETAKRQTLATTPDLQARLRTVAQRLPQQSRQWAMLARRIATESDRIDKLSGLPKAFWHVFNVQMVRAGAATDGMMKQAGKPFPEALVNYLKNKLSLYEQYGPEKVVDIGIEGGGQREADNVESTLRTALGGGMAVISMPGGHGTVVTVAPVDKFADVVAALKIGKVIAQDEARGAVKIQVMPNGPSVASGFDRPLGSGPIGPGNLPDRLRQFAPPGAPDAAKMHYVPFEDRVPAESRVTIEIVNYDEIRRAGQAQPEATRDESRRFGGGGPLMDRSYENMGLLIKLAGGYKGLSFEGRGKVYRIGPIADFDTYCNSLDFATIVAKDDAARTVKIKIDPAKLTNEAIRKRVGAGADLAPWDRERLGLDAKSIAESARAKLPRSFAKPSGEGADPSDAAMVGAVPKATPSAAAGADASDAELEYARLADILHDGRYFDRKEAMKQLLQIEPGAVTDKETKKRIARGFREIAFNETGSDRGGAIRGLVIWGGKFANPLLVDLLDREQLAAPPEVFDGLAILKEPTGAAAACRKLGNFFNHDAAVACLRKMGPVAEDSLIKTAPSNDPKVSLAAVKLLGELGTDKSIEILSNAAKSRNPDIRDAARDAVKSIRQRKKQPAEDSAPK